MAEMSSLSGMAGWKIEVEFKHTEKQSIRAERHLQQP
jgi:hypothetical protein